MNYIFVFILLGNISHAETTSTCPAKELCPRFSETLDKCEKNIKSNTCNDFIELYKKLVPRYDCKRSFDTNPAPAVWLCDEGTTAHPNTFERGVALLSKLKSKKARAFFGSPELRSTLDGDIAEEYLKKSLKIEKLNKKKDN